jgi:uncharacterized protein (UPF0332 family)
MTNPMSKEENFLLEKARENLKVAQLLVREGFFDVVASRTYYAMFYIAQALLLRLGQTYSSHSAVISAYGKEYAKTGILDPKFHQWLIKSKGLRQTGDYGMMISVFTPDVKEALERAAEFLNAAEAYLSRGE